MNFESRILTPCIKCCDDAVERGRELRVDYKMVARALTRKGNALAKKGELEAAARGIQQVSDGTPRRHPQARRC